MAITTPDIRPCRNKLHEYDHTQHRECPECRRKYNASPQRRESNRKHEAKNRDKRAERKREYRQTLPGIVAQLNNYARRCGYADITTPLDEILFPSPEVCQCCGRKCWTGKRLCLDHDHKTGEVRAWLCNGCNTGKLHGLTRQQVLLWVRIMFGGYRPAWTGPGGPERSDER